MLNNMSGRRYMNYDASLVLAGNLDPLQLLPSVLYYYHFFYKKVKQLNKNVYDQLNIFYHLKFVSDDGVHV